MAQDEVERAAAARTASLPAPPPGGWRQADHGLDVVAQMQAADAVRARHTIEYPAGLTGQMVETVDAMGIADEIGRLARTDLDHARGVLDALTPTLPHDGTGAAETAEMLARDRLDTMQSAEVMLGARRFDAPTVEVDPAEARSTAQNILSAATDETWWGREVTDISAVADDIIDLRDAQQPDLALAVWAQATATLDVDAAADLDRDLANRPAAPGVAILRAPVRRATDIPLLSGPVGDFAAGLEALATGADIVPNRLTGTALSGRALQDAKMLAFFDVASAGFGGALSRGVRVIDEVGATVATAARPAPPAGLLADELDVGTFASLRAAGQRGDNITPHHVPSANRMGQAGVASDDGIAINMEQPVPGAGGRHRQTFTYGTQADADMTPRDALAAGLRDLRTIYQGEGLYGDFTRSRLQELARQNRDAFPEIFVRDR
ncbi:MAG: hypothetical protein AAGE03_13105 [Pseudomonadota bacterium]